MKRRATVAAIALALCAVAPAEASQPERVTADLDGWPIPVGQIADNYCTDRDFPVIHCFTTAEGLEAAQQVSSASTIESAQATDYVVVYAGTYYSGSYMYVSQDYDALAVVGWNDRIRSFRGLNGMSGTFYTDWFRGGAVLSFCCNTAPASLSSTFDRQISSVYQG